MTALRQQNAYASVTETTPAAPQMASGLDQQWAAVSEAGAAVAALAQIDHRVADSDLASGTEIFAVLDPDTKAMAETGVGDLAMILQPGLRALLALAAEGGNAAAPARVLWAEFCAARRAILSLGSQ